MKKTVFLAYLIACGLAFAQAPTASPTTVAFTYQYNNASNTLTSKVTAKLSTTAAMSVTYTSLPLGWLSVTPIAGSSPLVLAVNANPTSLSPGTYNGSIAIFTGAACGSSANCTTVPVTLTITNPASSLLLSAPGSATYPIIATTTATAYTLALPYNSGTTPPSAEIDVSTTADIIPFTVTTAVTKAGSGTVANWLRVSNQLPGTGSSATSTSGVASGSSIVPIYVTLDQPTLDTLDAINYTGTITIAPVKTGSSSSGSTSTSFTVTVTLSVAPGQPSLTSVFPPQVPVIVASTTVTPVPPILTLFGDNFFNNGSWVFYQRPDLSFHPLPTTWVSRKLLTATIPVADLTSPNVAASGEAWKIYVVNGAPNSVPSNSAAQSSPFSFAVTDPTQPYIQAVDNAASYLSSATQLGAATPFTSTSVVSPREIVSIFGGNFGTNSICSNSPITFADGNNVTQSKYDVTIASTTNPACANIAVWFESALDSQSFQAPLLMATSNQINAIVPYELAQYPDGTTITVSVAVVGAAQPATYPTVKMSFDPGIFTFGGNGQGQAAVLNVDATTGAVTVNGNANAPKGSPIEIFMTGLGDLLQYGSPALTMVDGQVANVTTGPVALAVDSYRVLIGGQSAPIFYAGTAGTGVAGLVQINAIVPPGTASGAQPITVEIGPVINGNVTARRSQTGVTINVK
ncbi:exported hypothetical protein [Candidatus Sulfopaludibacter sp. SbA4]|nr:exported hypothetical protein [Candidatus Sulfopaludibacter sp. SbA4]